MSSIIFKQSYKPRAGTSTPGLNVRHLQYIATRPGVIQNKGCGFGLWGTLPGNEAIRIQNDLSLCKKIVREASADRTLYRAIISVGRKDAERHGLYDRARWEQLINDHIGVLAKEMDIKPENFCWVAAMHRSKGHPHVHLLYWDNSTTPRPEGMGSDKFERMAERVRAEFAGDINHEEIRETQQQQRQDLEVLRAGVQALCLEANPAKMLDFPKICQSGWLNGMAADMSEILRQIPRSGSLRYAYLPPEYKARVDSFIGKCLNQPEFAKELKSYYDTVEKVGKLYGNGQASIDAKRTAATQRLHKALGNQVMEAVRTLRDEIFHDPPAFGRGVENLIREAVENIVPAMPAYHQLCWLMPPERIPRNCMQQIPDFHRQLTAVVDEVMQDARLRIRLQSYALQISGINLEERPKYKHTANEPRPHTVNGKILSEAEWSRYQEAYGETRKELREQIVSKVREDVGWNKDAVHSGTAMAICDMFSLLSRLMRQQQAGLSLARMKQMMTKDQSKEAKKDERVQQQSPSDWGNE